MKRIFLSLTGFMMLFGLIAAPVQSMALAAPVIRTQGQPEAATFAGIILQDGDTYVLSDAATKSKYILDDAKKPSVFEGKTVKVTGTLDKARNLIHVDTIQEIV